MTQDRRDRVRSLLGEQGLDALLVTYLTNVRYLSGFSGSNGAVLVGRDPKDDRLITDFRYVTQAAAECPGLDVLVERAVDAGGAAHAVAGEIGRASCRERV